MIRLGLTSVFFRISTSDLSRLSFLISLHASLVVRHSELKDKNGQQDDPIEGHAETHQPLSVECGRGEQSRARVPLTSSSRCQGGASVLFLSLISHSFVLNSVCHCSKTDKKQFLRLNVVSLTPKLKTYCLFILYNA